MKSAAVQWQTIYTFHMMLFFLVSGAVNLKLPKKAWPDALRGSLRLLALAWVVQIIGAIFAMSFGYAPEATRSVWDAAVYIVDPILEGYCWSVGVLWFLTSLCFVQFLAYILLQRIPALAVALGAMAATALVVYFDAPNYFLFRTWMPGLSFFALGYLFSQWQGAVARLALHSAFCRRHRTGAIEQRLFFLIQRAMPALRHRSIRHQDVRRKLRFPAALFPHRAAWLGRHRKPERRAGPLPGFGNLRLHGKKQPESFHHQRVRGDVPAALHPADTLARLYAAGFYRAGDSGHCGASRGAANPESGARLDR